MKSFFAFLILMVSVVAYAAPTALTVTELSDTAVATPFEDVDSTNGNEFANRGGDVICEFYNGDGGGDSATVTIDAQNETIEVGGYGSLEKTDPSISLADGDRKIIGPFAPIVYNDATGNVEMSFSGAASGDVDVACMRVPRP